MNSTWKNTSYLIMLILIVQSVNGRIKTNSGNIVEIVARQITQDSVDRNTRLNSEVVIIRSAKTDNCLDSSCGLSVGHHPFAHPSDCDWSYTFFHWWFAGPTLRSYNCAGNSQCLVCYNGTDTCNVEAVDCSGTIDQRWFLKTHSGVTKNEHAQVRFSIHSEKYPENCITLYDVHGEGPIHLKLQPGDTTPSLEQSFYIDSDGFSTVKNLQDRNNLEPNLAPPSYTTTTTTGKPHSVIQEEEDSPPAYPIENNNNITPFVCKSNGKYGDAKDCTVFHECIPKGNTTTNPSLTHYQFTCAPNTVYCEKSENCDWEINCPCKK